MAAISQQQIPPESSPTTAAKSTTATTNITPSRSTGSLTKLVNRRSNPIISTEDDEVTSSDGESLDNHLRANDDADPVEAAVEKGTTVVASNNNDNAIAMAGSVEIMSLDSNSSSNSNRNYLPKTMSNIDENKETKKTSPLSSRVPHSFDGGDMKIPSALSNLTDATEKSNGNSSSGSSHQRRTERAKNNPIGKKGAGAGDFDFDATVHHRKKGKGYLASQVSLSTPTDVFANGCTLLQLCAIGNLSAVRDYVSQKFDNVNFRDYDRRTALHVAASEGHLDVVKYLVQKGANVNRSDRWGGSPLDDAHRHRHTDVARCLRGKGARTGSLNLTSNLIAAAAAGDIEEVRMMCGINDNVSKLVMDLSGSQRQRASNRASGAGPQTTQSSASDASGGPRGRANSGASSLDMSEPTARTDDNAVDLHRGDYDKRTALHLAAGEGHLDVVRFLIKRGADVNAEDRWGGRPLDDALQKGNEVAARMLKKAGAISAYNDSVTSSRSHFRSSFIDNLDGSAKQSDSLAAAAVEDDENFRIDFSELEMIERIGSGAFGEIYKCRWRGILVAAKCIKASKIQKEWLLKNRSHQKKEDHIKNRIDAIKQTTITDDDKQLALADFRRETAIMRRLRHPNIVMMLAYSHTQDVEVMISEICRCSLLDVFKANNISNSQIPKRTQIVYAQQLAKGMNHLHKSRPPIIHRDLKPANLLVDFSGTLKIADFGLAKIRPNPEQNESEAFLMTGETGSYRFMAPEVFRSEEYTETVDVYSYAMIFYYMLRSTPPWAGLSGLDAVTKAAVDGERPIIPRNVDERLSTLLKRCWDENGRARPSFEDIITALNVYSHDVFKMNDKEYVSARAVRDNNNCGCVIS